MTDDGRKEFEAWYVLPEGERWFDPEHEPSIYWDSDRGIYADRGLQDAYDAWLAARRNQSEQVRELVEAVEQYAKSILHDQTYGSTSSLLHLEACRQGMLAAAAQLKEQQDG